jgi:hypothetical protein
VSAFGNILFICGCVRPSLRGAEGSLSPLPRPARFGGVRQAFLPAGQTWWDMEIAASSALPEPGGLAAHRAGEVLPEAASTGVSGSRSMGAKGRARSKYRCAIPSIV